MKVVFGGAKNSEPSIPRLAGLEFCLTRGDALTGNGNPHCAVEILRGEGVLTAQDLGKRSLSHQLTPARPGPGADVENVVGGADRVLIVLNDDHGIPKIAKVAEGLDEAVVVALVQADAWLVEDIQHPRKTRADLGGQPDALGFAAGKRAALAVELQVVQADFVQKPQSLLNLPQHILHDIRFGFREGKRPHHSGSLANREGTEFLNAELAAVFCRKSDGKDFGTKSRPAAASANTTTHAHAEPLFGELALRSRVEVVEVREQAFVGL